MATSTNFFGPPSTQSSAADASFNAIVLIASVRELHEWAAVFERELLELFAERCAMVAAFHDALLLTATASREAGRLGAPTGAAVRRQWWLPLFGKVSFFTRRSPRRPTWFGRLNPFTWFSFAFDAGLPELPALRLSGAWRGFYRVNLWGVVGGLWDWATDRQLPTRPRFPRPSLPGMGYVRSVARWFGGLRLPGWLRWWSRHRADESLPQPRPGRGGWWDVRRFLGRLPRFGFPRWRLRGPGFDGPDLDAALRSLGSVRRRRPRWSFSLWWSTQHRPVSDYDASLLDLDEFALLSEQYGTLGASIRGGTTATRHGRHKRPRAKGHSAYTSAEYQQRDIIVPLSALRLVVGPVLDGSPITPGLFGPPVFPLVADLGRFERVVVLPGPVPTLSSVPGGDAVAWLEGCVARGGDVRLCFGQPGPRTYRPVALGGRAIVEPIAADHDVRSGEVPYEPGTILVVRGATASVMASRARTSDDDMLVVTASSIGWATPKTGRKVRGLGVVAALAQ